MNSQRCSTIKFTNYLEEILQKAYKVNPDNEMKDRLAEIKSKLSNDDIETLFEAVESVYTNNKKLKEENYLTQKLN